MRPLRNITGVIVGLEERKMKLRILAALVLVPLLLVIVFIAPKLFVHNIIHFFNG